MHLCKLTYSQTLNLQKQLLLQKELPQRQCCIEAYIKQLLAEVEHDILNHQNQGLCYLPKPKAQADNTDTRF